MLIVAKSNIEISVKSLAKSILGEKLEEKWVSEHYNFSSSDIL